MSRKKILLVDDDRVVVKSLTMKLSQGYDIVTAGDPSEAVGIARRERPDLIILDVNFPPDVASGGLVPWDGFRMMEWLQRVIEGKQIPVIILTGGDPAKFKAKALAAGAAAFFQKPPNVDDFLSAVHQVLGENQVEAKP